MAPGDQNVVLRHLPRTVKIRRLHKASLRYYDPNNWPLLREALKSMGRADLIGNGNHHLIPTVQPITAGCYESARKKNSTVLTIPSMVTEKPQPAALQGHAPEQC